jgi:hypothetical protein
MNQSQIITSQLRPDPDQLVPAEKLVEMPRSSKEIDCAGCGRPITVADRVCMAYCASCSADQGKKK